MGPDDQKAAMRLVTCWVVGVIAVVILAAILAFDGGKSPLALVFQEVLKWIGQVMLPICLLVLARVFGQNLRQTFAANLPRAQIHRLLLRLSVIYIVVAGGAILLAAKTVPDAGLKDHPYALLSQHEILSNFATVMVVLLWPILAILLDFLFPSDSGGPANPPPQPGPRD